MNIFYFVYLRKSFFNFSTEHLSTGPGRKNGGFTLIETLVAMMILSIALVIVLQLFSGGLNSSQRSGAYTLAIFHAREKMEEILLPETLVDGVYEGEFADGYTWQAEIVSVQSEEEEDLIRIPFVTFNIIVQVGWSEGAHIRHFEISTLKNSQKPEPAT